MSNQPIVKKSLKEISDNVLAYYENFVLDAVNDHCVRMAVMEGEYRWHYHQYTDEMFLVLEGKLKVEIKDQPTEFLEPGECLKIPANTIHKTSAIGRTVNLCFEKNADDTVFID